MRSIFKREGFTRGVIFVTLCASAAVAIIIGGTNHKWSVTSPSQAFDDILDRATIQAFPVGETAPRAKPTAPPPASPQAAMEAWWQVHQMQEWWKLHQKQAVQRPAHQRRPVPKPQPTSVELAERSWGVEDTGYDPPRYLPDTSMWPMHGPGNGK